ncbi:putative steryl acetyl hydrolase mug81 [Spathaspora sp. JA1]|nr:putative steryl acetyl hydrolase mug81 [Spathaspora sp. JA1]
MLSTVARLLWLPYVGLKTVVQFYTTGTVYSLTNPEFEDSLYKNVHLAVIYHMSREITKSEARLLVHKPITTIFSQYRTNPITQELTNFGTKFNNHSYWIHQVPSTESNKVLVYLHGGGYQLNMTDSQMLWAACMHYAIPRELSEKVSILVVDYSLSMFDHVYPTQLWETLNVYRDLIEQGYNEVHLMGDSCGAHLALSVARAIAYPKEAEEQFTHFPQFPFDFTKYLPQPTSLLLDSPWVEPCNNVALPCTHGVDTTGDLGSTTCTMGDNYVGTTSKELINNFLTYTNTNYVDHWSNVEAITNGKMLIVVGEREVLRDGIDKFYHIVNKGDNVAYFTEKGGIHAGVAYVETLDFMSKSGGQKVVDRDLANKYGINMFAKYLQQFVNDVSFLLKVCSIPYIVIYITVLYYTYGTPYSENNEFKDSLYKNVMLAIEYHVSGNYQKRDMKLACYEPIEKLFAKHKSSLLTTRLRNFGEKFDERGYWIHQAENKDKVLVYLHGGGYLLNLFDCQLVCVSALHYALEARNQGDISILVLDYSLTMFDEVYPTQLHQALINYKNLINNGYTNISYIGDSAGTHLALGVARSLAYPHEIINQFTHFPEFDFKLDFFNINEHQQLPQPESLILISPWVQPCTPPLVPNRRGINTWGDLGAEDTTLGTFALGDNDINLINNFFTFTNTNFDEHWARVDPINNGNTVIIVGEREVLRDGVDDLYEIINKLGKVEYHVEEGGIHAGLVYVESLDYSGYSGNKRALEGDFNDKYAFNIVADFLSKRN